MAKGLRSSRNKTNNSKLRSKVFGPVENARKERLSAKLLKLAATPMPREDADTGMDIEKQEPQGSEQKQLETNNAGLRLHEEDMDIGPATESTSAAKPTLRSTKRIERKGRAKAKVSMVFPVHKKGKRIGSRLNVRQKKQSLKL